VSVSGVSSKPQRNNYPEERQQTKIEKVRNVLSEGALLVAFVCVNRQLILRAQLLALLQLPEMQPVKLTAEFCLHAVAELRAFAAFLSLHKAEGKRWTRNEMTRIHEAELRRTQKESNVYHCHCVLLAVLGIVVTAKPNQIEIHTSGNSIFVPNNSSQQY
jgi:hypothetical protein